MATILVVDDDADVLETVTTMLSPEHVVVAVSEALEALTALGGMKFDLLLTDIRMPVHNGFTLVQWARERQPDLGVVLMSAYYDGADSLARQIVGKYAATAISKPLTCDSVNRAVTVALIAKRGAAEATSVG